MGWLRDAEHMRDYGHTWGPGHEREDYEDYESEDEDEELEAYRKQLREDRKLADW